MLINWEVKKVREEQFPFGLRKSALQQRPEHATRGVYLVSSWRQPMGKKAQQQDG
ncbi:MAG: hypothetical protein J7J76_05800 [Candidatus Latescibacteria bacterium]|nr:hypothetical protein [Candidatus Latescibacterota bacterium]